MIKYYNIFYCPNLLILLIIFNLNFQISFRIKKTTHFTVKYFCLINEIWIKIILFFIISIYLFDEIINFCSFSTKIMCIKIDLDFNKTMFDEKRSKSYITFFI